MTGMVRAGLIGADARLLDLVRHAAPLDDVRLVEWWPGVTGGLGRAAEAAALGTAVVPEWRPMAASPAMEALVVLDGAPVLEAAEAGLLAGKAVLVPGPCVPDAAAMARLARAGEQGGGVLLCGGELSYCDTALHARAVLRTGSLGTVHSLYLAVRAPYPQAGTPPVLDALGWDAFRFVLDCLPGALLHVHASGGALFGPAPDTLVVVARFAPCVVATIELSQCLPASIPAGRHGEVQFEIVGGAEVLRGDPFGSTVRLHSTAGSAGFPWGDDPIIAMLAELPDAVGRRIAGERDVAAHGRVLAMMECVRRSVATGAVALP